MMVDSFHDLFLTDTPFIDVRAEVEFAHGAFPTAFNAPILTTSERHLVGVCYKQQGQDKAIALGHELVRGELKQSRIEAWCSYANRHPNARLYCWRGGLRSNLAQQWMHQEGVDIPLINGGYKALRETLAEVIESASCGPLLVIGGKTGSAKTPLINSLPTGIDLEGFAHHRGSSFGRRVKQPPSQVNFENNLAIDILRKRVALPERPLFFEDESRMVGPLTLPLSLWQSMVTAPIAVIEMPLTFRVQRVLQEYVIDMAAEHIAADVTDGFEHYRQYLLASLWRIRKRLGSEKYRQLYQVMSQAIDRQYAAADTSAHEAWITVLLQSYYDPMYKYQLEKKGQRIAFMGDYNQVMEWATAQTSEQLLSNT